MLSNFSRRTLTLNTGTLMFKNGIIVVGTSKTVTSNLTSNLKWGTKQFFGNYESNSITVIVHKNLFGSPLKQLNHGLEP